MVKIEQIKLLSKEQIISLRNSWNNHIRQLFIKEKCEICGSKDNLELHHFDKSFSVLVNESIDILGINESNLIDRFDILKTYLLGVQTKIQYQTLCSKCHSKVHTWFSHSIKIYKMSYKERVDFLKEKMSKWLDKPLTKADKDKLVEEVGVRDKNSNIVKWTSLKKILQESEYEIKDKKIKEKGKQIRVTIITKKPKK